MESLWLNPIVIILVLILIGIIVKNIVQALKKKSRSPKKNIENSDSIKNTIVVKNTDVHYPAIRLISIVVRVYAWIVLLAGAVAFIASLNEDITIIMGIIALVVGSFNFIVCYAISESLVVLADISISARKILTSLNKKDI